jgi:hypothetical protein
MSSREATYLKRYLGEDESSLSNDTKTNFSEVFRQTVHNMEKAKNYRLPVGEEEEVNSKRRPKSTKTLVWDQDIPEYHRNDNKPEHGIVYISEGKPTVGYYPNASLTGKLASKPNVPKTINRSQRKLYEKELLNDWISQFNRLDRLLFGKVIKNGQGQLQIYYFTNEEDRRNNRNGFIQPIHQVSDEEFDRYNAALSEIANDIIATRKKNEFEELDKLLLGKAYPVHKDGQTGFKFVYFATEEDRKNQTNVLSRPLNEVSSDVITRYNVMLYDKGLNDLEKKKRKRSSSFGNIKRLLADLRMCKR